jgi:hypothetical protein
VTVTPFAKTDRTAAARSRAYRRRKRAAEAVTAPGVTPSPPSPPPIIVTPPSRTVTAITFTAGLSVSSVSAAFSVVGLTAIFAGSYWPIVAMGATVEGAKIAATIWLARGCAAPLVLRLAVAVLVVALMTVTSIGVYGFLAAAHVARVVTAEAALGERDAEVAARMRVQAAIVADFDRRLGQVDGAVTERPGAAAA